jgi:PAS domain S-box-containing protein
MRMTASKSFPNGEAGDGISSSDPLCPAIRILMLEDDANDAILIERELVRGKFNFSSKLVNNRDDYLTALREFTPDVILSDHRLNGFDGSAALALARTHCPDVPFITVSGVLSDESAAGTMQTGCTDYVLKDRLIRLTATVRRALQESELRRQRQQAEEAERLSALKFATLTETVPAVIFIHQGGKFRYLNAAAEAILGHPRADLLGTDFWNIVHPDFRELVRERGLSRADGQAVLPRYEFQIVTKNGQVRWVDCAAATIEFEGSTCVLGSAFDITDRKESQRRARALSDLGHQLSTAANPEQAARIVVDIAFGLLGWDACYLHLYAREQGLIVPILTMDNVDGERKLFPASTFTLDPTPLMLEVMEKGGRLFNREIEKAGLPGSTPFGDTTRRSRSLLYVPIRDGNSVIGILSIQSYTPCVYNEEALRTLQSIADHCGGALERINVAEALRRSEANMRGLVSAMPDWMFRVRADGMVVDWKAPNDARSGNGEFTGKTVATICSPDLVKQLMHHIREALETGTTQLFEFQYASETRVGAYEARIAVSGPDEVLAIVRDITEKKRLEKEVLEISTNERRRIGYDLHDGLGQYLAGIALQAKLLEESLAAASLPQAREARAIVRRVNTAIRQARSLAKGLDPIEIEQNGLVSALQQLASDTEKDSSVKCLFKCAQPAIAVDRADAVHLYRIAQEAIHNAVKHARPGKIEVELNTDRATLSLAIRDDGIGVLPKKSDGMGLRIMRYRAHSLGGFLNIEPRPRLGTVVECRVPRASNTTRVAAQESL